jgi:hypothetical protein
MRQCFGMSLEDVRLDRADPMSFRWSGRYRVRIRKRLERSLPQ